MAEIDSTEVCESSATGSPGLPAIWPPLEVPGEWVPLVRTDTARVAASPARAVSEATSIITGMQAALTTDHRR